MKSWKILCGLIGLVSGFTVAILNFSQRKSWDFAAISAIWAMAYILEVLR